MMKIYPFRGLDKENSLFYSRRFRTCNRRVNHRENQDPIAMKPILKSHSKISLVVAVLTLALAGTPARMHAASSGQVVINSATANLVTNKITITGANFGSTVPSVKLNTTPLTVNSSTST